ncbi:MAG: hypothetical protein OEV64_05950 [Desulfobulbaceae bacterium]|nr:hypothetical protein [Desulfobulbaceae bacterium]
MSKKNLIDLPQEYWPEIEDLPGDLALIAAVVEEQLPGCGVMVALLLSKTFRSQELYIHSLECLERQWRNDTIRKEYENGTPVRDLCTKWTLSQRWVEDILGKPDVGGRGKQLTLFG